MSRVDQVASLVNQVVMSTNFRHKPGVKLRALTCNGRLRDALSAISMPSPQQARLGGVFRSGEGGYEKIKAHGATQSINFKQVYKQSVDGGNINFIDFAVIPPGSYVGLHRHEEELDQGKEESSQEIYVITQGNGIAILNGDLVRVKQGDALMKGPNGFHGIYNLDSRKTLKMVVVDVANKTAL